MESKTNQEIVNCEQCGAVLDVGEGIKRPWLDRYDCQACYQKTKREEKEKQALRVREAKVAFGLMGASGRIGEIVAFDGTALSYRVSFTVHPNGDTRSYRIFIEEQGADDEN